uniref:MFS domain-containing protein n=1 Tax=Heterorhabditis bacteriophora TaxID=37862 RepID=A0A1I7XPM1_HETBA
MTKVAPFILDDLFRGIIYIFIKSNVTAEENEKKDEELGKQSSYEKEKSKNTKKNISVLERAVSLLCAMASGLFYGSMLTPVNYIRVLYDL